MKTQRIIRRTLLALALSAFGAGTMAQEGEPNHPITSAHQLTFSGAAAAVTGTVGQTGATHDVDFFKFQAQVGDVIRVNIGRTTNGLDASLALFGPGPTFPLRVWSFDEPLDDDSTSEADPRIDSFTITEAGTWTVGVSAFPVFFASGGTLTRTRALSNGEYTLTITVLATAEKTVFIDIKPGSSDRQPINPKSKGTIPVAILSAPDFTPADIDQATLTFGKTGNEASFRRCVPAERDLNADGKPDLVCHFDNEATNFSRGDSMGVLKGKTKSGQAFKATEDLKVVPEKRQN